MEEILLVEKNGEIKRFRGLFPLRFGVRILVFLSVICLLAALFYLYLYLSNTRETKRLLVKKQEMIREISGLDRAGGIKSISDPAPPPPPDELVEQDTVALESPAREIQETTAPAPTNRESEDGGTAESEKADESIEPETEIPEKADVEDAPAPEPELAPAAEPGQPIVFISEPDTEKDEQNRVSVKRFEMVMEDGGDTFHIRFSIKNTSSDGAPLKGYGFVILKNKQASIDRLVLPAADMKDGLPAPVRAGFSYSVANFGTLALKSLDKSYLKRFNAADMILFDKKESLLFQQSFSLKQPGPS